ncbi:monovalent cation:proton antiporter-2 (CPA2) family protein [Telmatospirillum sp. J64-1]|uniref:monovalent cation:proton antiporter-2 (CPA2) family protein n=1 Tax=Telmatospirillum sp. J64-1 TaxID=2502183 RepID=UPI00115EEE3E|nr:monovalent cation:proton antiporter-2 (CPA2) family protein [Telmatospirillum sp. J64-1]
MNSLLVEVIIFLAASAIAAPLGKYLGVSSVIGYLAAGMLIGPHGLGLIGTADDVAEILHFGEFGVVLLLFLIGLELRPARLWAMRSKLFGLGGLQVGITAIPLSLCAWLFGLAPGVAVLIGFSLSLSSTAFALQLMEERGELNTRSGRLGFSTLLFQDLAAIPLIALLPLLSRTGTQESFDWTHPFIALGVIAAVIVGGRLLLERLYHLVASTRVKEAMTASVLLTILVVVLLFESIGLSAALGGFIAGAVLAESSYRHEVEADLAPFEGLLLGVFFVAVGMALDLGLVLAQPLAVAAIALGLVVVKSGVLYGLGRWQRLPPKAARSYALYLCQGGEFSFVLFSAAAATQVIAANLAAILTAAVTISMLMTPVLIRADEWLFPPPAETMRYDTPPQAQGHVIIAGFGRFGQIVARVLRAKQVPFTALDISPEQVDFVARYGNKIYYGDASRLDLLQAAQAENARAFILAIDDVEASVRTAEMVRSHFPKLPVYARARNRRHVHRLMDAGVTLIQRETFLSSLELTRQLLIGLGWSEDQAAASIETFREQDVKRLKDDYHYHSDEQRMLDRARADALELERLFAEDTEQENPPKA